MSRLRKIRLLLLTLAASCIYYGAHREETKIIFNKAVRICMECIGLG